MRRSCKYYDYGFTAPRAYGAFCFKQKCCMTKTLCIGCKLYKKGSIRKLFTKPIKEG